MIKYAGMKSEENKSSDFGQLPVGPYVAKVLSVRIDGFAPDQSLVIALDVSEGEYKDFFMNKFNAQKNAGSRYGEVKFKGTYRLRIPNPNNTNAQYPEKDEANFNNMIFRFEQSNPGLKLVTDAGFDENRLVGLTVGINMQEDTYNGNAFTRIGRLETADDIRKGLVRPMSPKKRKDSGNDAVPPAPEAPADPVSGFTPVETDDLPF